MVAYRATLDVPDDLVSWLENLIATRRGELGSYWRKLTSFDQVVVALVHLAKGDAFAQLGARFGVSADTAWHYVSEGVDVLAACAPDLADALKTAGSERRLLLDGTPVSHLTLCEPGHRGQRRSAPQRQPSRPRRQRSRAR